MLIMLAARALQQVLIIQVIVKRVLQQKQQIKQIQQQARKILAKQIHMRKHHQVAKILKQIQQQ